MKNKFLLIISSVMLVSCGGTINGSSISSPTTSVSPNTSDSFIKEEVSNENLEMFMYGGLYLNGMRTIYAKLSEQYKDSEIVWESSDESIVSATGRENLSSECLVTALDYGVAYVKASLKDNPSIYSVKKFEIKKGEAMPVELFNSISGAVTMNTTDQYIMVDNKYNETVTKTEYLDVIYEENDSTNSFTDAYQMTITNKNGEVDKVYKYVRDENKKQYVATEYLDYRNNVRASAVETEDGKMYWDFSTYFNPLADTKNVTNLDFETFDGGKTYHYVSYYTGMENLVLALYLTDFSPDSMYFEVNDDALTLNTYIEPYNSQTTSSYKYARKVTTTFSDIGTSVIDHLKPYEKKDFHSKVESSINSLKNNNYTVNYSITFKDDNSSIAYQYKYTDNAIDEIIYNAGKQSYHAGYYKVSDQKFVTYEYDDELEKLTFVKSYDKKWEESSLYPTFDFAVEVFNQIETNKYQTYEEHALLLTRCIPLNDIYAFALQNSGKANIELNDQNNSVTISSLFYMDEEEVEIIATYSNIGSTTVGIDFSKGQDADLPTSWQEANSSLYSELVTWELEDIVPYLYIKQNYEEYTGIKGSPYAVDYVYFNTNLFDSEADRDKFILDYQNLLIQNGFVEDGVNDISGFKMYTKDGYSIGVGIETKRQGIAFELVETLRAQITIASPYIVEAPWA